MNGFIFNKDRMDFRYSSGATVYSEKLLDGTYAGAYQDEKINMFLKNLGA